MQANLTYPHTVLHEDACDALTDGELEWMVRSAIVYQDTDGEWRLFPDLEWYHLDQARSDYHRVKDYDCIKVNC